MYLYSHHTASAMYWLYLMSALALALALGE